MQGQGFQEQQATCFVVKDAGDDPDVTDGIEVHVTVEMSKGSGIEIAGGVGVGTVTK
ncbi:MAG: cobalt-precorrin-5B (C(1))-methyltransferase, partial [Desulfuromonadales bacterium]|nr:cobalt-precorrin-5B (C(1))-methyltransferase [Desulfuromonadales bacterium]NIS43719.1 cobalt-precorrin-5B (C(1))-methyltransferase [Desulfuromonadales bacterium]